MVSIFLGWLDQTIVCKYSWGVNSAWDFFGVNFWSRDFFGFVGGLRDLFLVLIFASIWSLRSLEMQSTPLGTIPRLLGPRKEPGGTWVNVCWVCAAGLSEPLPHYSLFFGQLWTPS